MRWCPTHQVWWSGPGRCWVAGCEGVPSSGPRLGVWPHGDAHRVEAREVAA